MRKFITNAQIIKALLENGSQQKAARSLGITEQTIINRMKKTEFQALYQEAQHELLRVATRKLSNASSESVDLLLEKMRDEDVSDRIRIDIAKEILHLQRNYIMLDDLIMRVAELENNQYSTESKEQKQTEIQQYKRFMDKD